MEMTDAPPENQEPSWECKYLNSVIPGLGDEFHRRYEPARIVSYIQTLLDDFKVAIPDRQHRANVCVFLIQWYKATTMNNFGKHLLKSREACYAPLWEVPDIIQAEELGKTIEDIQGIRWDLLDQNRRSARWFRRILYPAFAPLIESTVQDSLHRPFPETERASEERLFKFHLTNTKLKPVAEHFQLRNVLATTSRTDIYYADSRRIMRTDLLSTEPDCVMDLSKASHDSEKATKFRITTLGADQKVLIAGGLHGDYALLDVRSQAGTKPTTGILSDAENGVTNHIHIFNDRRNSSPRALFASNDTYLRTLDCHTNQFIAQYKLHRVVNCAATSPDGRLRLVVGDFPSAFLLDADTGHELFRMRTHRADAFACAWSDDGIHVAWAAQDKRIYVADARTWGREHWKPLLSMPTEMDCVRSLRFSPLGGGRPVLVAAEAADFVHVFDAQTFGVQQTIEFFGNVAGTAFSADGEELLIANSDAKFGGIMSFRRAGYGNAEIMRDHLEMPHWNAVQRRTEGLYNPYFHQDLTEGQQRDRFAPERIGLQHEEMREQQQDRVSWMGSALKELGDDIMF